MHKLFTICLNRNVEFSVVGVVNAHKGTVKFQGLLNGIPFIENADYEKVRARIMRAVEINQPEKSELAS